MASNGSAQGARAYKNVPNAFVHRRSDGVRVALSMLTPDDPGIEDRQGDEYTAKMARQGSERLLRALQAARG